MWNTQWDSNASGSQPTRVAVYIAGLRGSETIELDHNTVDATTPYLEEIQAMVGTMRAFSNVCNVQFLNSSSQSGADLIFASVDNADADGALGWANPPGTENSTEFGDFQSLIVANYEAYDPDFPDPDLLAPGGFDFITFIHEFGHAMGLAHPHDGGGGSSIFPGVSGPFGDYGDFDMNQGIYTMMSYNDGWQTAPHGLTPAPDSGYEMTPMALDIAALQFMYGANDDYKTGNNTYALPESNEVGTGYSCIWDAGGRDRIVGAFDLRNIIDLRAATLALAEGGGGFVSYARGIHGGFTIANGAVIENALGGDDNDQMTGNDAANRMNGAGGNDRIAGGSGADTLIGEDGGDTLTGGGAVDSLRGGAGDDSLVGDSGNDVLFGGDGEDSLEGGTGADTFVYRHASDSYNETRDLIDGFTRGDDRIDVAQIDANENAAGNQAFKLDRGGAFTVGEIRQVESGNDVVLRFNTDDDAGPEMTILVKRAGGLLSNADFVF